MFKTKVNIIRSIIKRKKYYLEFNRQAYEFFKKNNQETIINLCSTKTYLKNDIKKILKLALIAKTNSFRNYKKIIKKEKWANELPIDLFEENSNKQRLNLKKYKELLRNKKIVVVGPASYLIGKNKGEFIDSFDLVVRINFQWPIKNYLSKDYGKRIDILYHCCNDDFPIELLFVKDFSNIKFVCLESGLSTKRLKQYCDNFKIPVLNVTKIYKGISYKICSCPTTGLVAISHLISLPLSELYVIGMTMQASPYYDGYLGKSANQEEQARINRGLPTWLHYPQKSIKYLFSLKMRYPKLLIDEEAVEIMRRFEHQVGLN